jgi:tagatose 6-phosphate kinase
MIICLGTTPTVQRTMTFAKLSVNDVNRATSVRQFASGKSVNAARVLHTLGEDCLAAGLLGGDSGKFMREDLDRAGIAHDFVETSPVSTRLCLTLLDESNHTATELIEEPSPPPGHAFDVLFQKLDELMAPRRATLLAMCGTLAPGAGDDYYAKCVRIARQRDVRTIVDAKGPPLRLALREAPTVVKPNRAELATALDMSIDSEAALRVAMQKVVSLGAQWAAVTHGVDDTMISDGSRFWRIATPKVQMVNPIGSGDSFAAGLAAGLRRGQQMPEACRLAVACASANAMTSNAGEVRTSDVENLLSQIVVRSD